MGTGTYITRRNGSANFYARVLVPEDLQKRVGRAEIWQSLRTADRKEAGRRSAPVFAKHFADFDAMRRTRPATEADLQDATFEHYTAELAHDARDRADMARRLGLEKAEKQRIRAELASGVEPHLDHLIDIAIVADPRSYERESRERRRMIIADHLATGETITVHWAADAVIESEALAIKKGSPAYIDLCQRLQRAELEALKRVEERDRGDWGGHPTDPAVKPVKASQKPLTAKPGESIPELFESFYRERAGSVRDDTWSQNRMVVGLFADYLGRSAHISAINRRAISAWKQQLMLWPRKASDIREFEGLGFKEIIAKNATLKKQPISDKTINRYLSGLGKFCLWLLANDYLEADVMRGQYLGLDKSKTKIRPYRDDQIAAIFGSPLFVGCKDDKKAHLPGEHLIRDWRYWVPQLALYSGARLGELCQLLTADVRRLGETWVMHVTLEGEGDKSVKTAGSQRVVPLHPKLIELGFLEYHAAQAKEPRLFPELKRDERGHFGDPSRFFGRYFAKIGVKTDDTQNFHSFRHGIADAFRRAGYLNEEFAPLLGHVKGTTTGRYGNLREGELSALKKMIDAVKF